MNIRCRADSYYRAADACAGGPVSLYIHYPFCVRKCRYCDFLSGPSDARTRQRYLEALCEEVREKSLLFTARPERAVNNNGKSRFLRQGCREGAGSAEAAGLRSGAVAAGFGGCGSAREDPELSELPEVDTVFFGGGTPSLMSPRELDHLMFVLSCRFRIDADAEITLECNPGTAGEDELRAFCESGVNRISIGVQSFREEELALLGRIHTAQETRDCVRNARRAGFSNLSMDLMSALPGQTREQWMYNLREAVYLEPEHLSAYGLILEEGTPLKAACEGGSLPPLPNEEEDRRMYHDTRTFLEQNGYYRYEISNYARPGFESRHNNGYWLGHPYLGLGLGASSYLILPDGVEDGNPEDPGTRQDGTTGCRLRIRWSNPSDLSEYLRYYEPENRENRLQETIRLCEAGGYPGEGGRQEMALPPGAEILGRQDQMAEFMFLGLRRMKGVSEADFAAEFGCSIDSVYGNVLRRYIGLELLRREGGRIALTEQGIDVSNTVMADFLL